MTIFTTCTFFALLLSSVFSAFAFDATVNSNLVAYWGQNSYGATNPTNTANWQTNLTTYCADDTVDVFPLAFLDVFFGTGGLPEINFANICSNTDDPVFAGTQLANCQFMATDIQTCQAAGKIITLSMGGATGSAGFTSDAQATEFATLIWNLFLGGTSNTRPFGDAVLDGIDLDIEGGTSTGIAAFVTQIRTLAKGASKPYYITGAPQCPFPDAFLGSVIDSVGFDMVYVQFYNNYCGLTEFSGTNDWNFATWDTWARTVSPNPDVKIYIGAPASPLAAGSGYVDAATLANIAKTTQAQYSSFGGVMLWDISQAVANNRFDASIKTALLGGSSPPPPPTTSAVTTTSTTVGQTSTRPISSSKPTSTDTTTSTTVGQTKTTPTHSSTTTRTITSTTPISNSKPTSTDTTISTTVSLTSTTPISSSKTTSPSTTTSTTVATTSTTSISSSKTTSADTTTSTTRTTVIYTSNTASTSAISTGTTSFASGGTCAGISPWATGMAYPSGSKVTNGGDLWTSTQWSYNEIPGGSADVWLNSGACTVITGTVVATTTISTSSAVTQPSVVYNTTANTTLMATQSSNTTVPETFHHPRVSRFFRGL